MTKHWQAVWGPLGKLGGCLVIFCMIFMGCKGQNKAAAAVQESLHLELQDYYGGFETDTAWTVKNEKGLQGFMAQVNKTRKPGLPIPKIDFSKRVVLIACGGTGSPGPFTGLVCAEDSDTEIHFTMIHDRAEHREAGGLVSFYIYSLPVPSKSIVFSEQDTTYE